MQLVQYVNGNASNILFQRVNCPGLLPLSGEHSSMADELFRVFDAQFVTSLRVSIIRE